MFVISQKFMIHYCAKDLKKSLIILLILIQNIIMEYVSTSTYDNQKSSDCCMICNKKAYEITNESYMVQIPDKNNSMAQRVAGLTHPQVYVNF